MCFFLPDTDGLLEEEHLSAHNFPTVGEESLENSHEDHGTRTPDTREEAVSWYLVELKGNITLVHHRMDQFVRYLR